MSMLFNSLFIHGLINDVLNSSYNIASNDRKTRKSESGNNVKGRVCSLVVSLP
jgi:hypothetical protein